MVMLVMMTLSLSDIDTVSISLISTMPLWEGKIHPPSLSKTLSIYLMMMMRISVSETEILSLSFDRLYLFLKDRDRPVLSQREIR